MRAEKEEEEEARNVSQPKRDCGMLGEFDTRKMRSRVAQETPLRCLSP